MRLSVYRDGDFAQAVNVPEGQFEQAVELGVPGVEFVCPGNLDEDVFALVGDRLVAVIFGVVR